MKLILILSILFTTLNGFSQIENIKIKYFKKEKAFGAIDKETKKIIIKPIYNRIINFYQNDTLTDLLAVTLYYSGNRYSQSFLVNLKGERVSNFSTHHIYNQTGSFSYLNSMRSGRHYYLDTNCICIPKDYTPCPNRVPIDIKNASTTQQNIQNLEYLYEFESMDSCIRLVDNYIDSFPEEPQYLFYKAWLLQHGFETFTLRLGDYNFQYEEDYDVDFMKSYPKYIWDFEHSMDSTYINQAFSLEQDIDFIDFDWEERNRFYEYNSHDSLNYVKVYNLLEKILVLEKENIKIISIVKAWQHDLLSYHLKGGNRKQIIKIEKDIKQLKKKDYFIAPSITGLITSSFFKYSKSPSYGIKIGIGNSKKNNPWLYGNFIKFQLGYEKFILDPELQAFIFSEEVLISNGYLQSGSAYGNFRGIGIKNMSINILNLSFLSKKDGYTAFSYAPQIGFHFWNFTLDAGYNFIRKTKFPQLKGPFASLNLTMHLYKMRDFQYKYQRGTNLFE